jgi:hypothetical protein
VPLRGITKYNHNDHVKEHVARIGEKCNAYGSLVGKPEGKGPPGIPTSRWKNNIKIDLRDTKVLWAGFSWLRIETSGGFL